MPLAAPTAGTVASQPAGFESKAAFGPATVAGRLSGAMLKHAHIQDSTKSDSACSSVDLVLNSSSASATSCNTALLWHPEDDKSVDQDDGWQVVAGKSSSKPSGQHPPHQPASTGIPSTGSTGKGQVCGRCGMRGHLSANCKQPYCSRCNKWWHTQDECAKACYTCGSLDHRVCGASLCKSYKCRECGLYGHVYAECPNIRCNLCSEIGHKALECPSIICNICKQKGHKAVHCTQPRYGSGTPAAASKPAAAQPVQSVPGMQQLRPVTAKHSQIQPNSNSSSSVTSPTSVSSPALATATTRLSAAVGSAAAAAALDAEAPVLAQGNPNPANTPLELSEVPMQQLQRPSNLVEQQQLQQQHSRMLALLLKAAPDLAIACLDDSNKLHAVYMIEPQYLMQLLNSAAETPEMQRQQLEAAVASSERQLQRQQQQPGQLGTSRTSQLPPTAGGIAVQRRLALSSSNALSLAAAAVSPVEDATDATQGIKPGDLAPQHAKQLVVEFGDMLPSRWQQLPSWRQLEARLSFPDGNYVQRRLQFREKRRQLQLLTLQLRATSSGKQQAAAAANSRAGGVAAITGRPAAHPRVVPEMSAATAASTPQPQPQHQIPPASKPASGTPCSYAAALAGRAVAGSAGIASPCSSTSSSLQVQAPGSPFADPGASITAAAVGVAVCSRCGMMGHSSCSCVQPRCTRCHLWWHTEAQCNSACQFCGSLDHTGDAEQPSSCKSFKCKACRMFGHTQSICPHVQLHSQQLQRQSSSLGSVNCLLPPASPLSSRGPGTAGSSSNGSSDTSSICPPDSPGLGQQGIKPKDLLPEHAKALQDEFPNALPPGWQQMGSWRMVEERLRVVAVEGAVFSKRRQMWRDRRKHYQALTAQALAAAARSAAAANIAAAEESMAAAAAAAQQAGNTGTAGQLLVGGAGHAPMGAQSAHHQHLQGVDKQQAQSDSAKVGQEGQHGAEQKNELQACALQQQHQESEQYVLPADAACAADKQGDHQLHHTHDLPDNQQCSMDPVLVPEWQQQQGSLFGLVDAAPGSMPMDSTVTGSAFSCDTHFTSSPTEASRTPNVMLSPFIDRLAYSDGSTPAAASANSSKMVTPAANHSTLQSCASFSAATSSPMPPAACSTPVPTPRSAADAAAGGAAATAASASSGVVYTSGGMMPVDGHFSPMSVPHSAAAAMAMQPPIGYPSMNCAPPTSPMDVHNAAAAAAMALGRPAGPNMYQHMVHVAQRQSQLQQQLMLQQGRYRSPAEQPLGSQQQQMFLQMQQQQMRMRQCRMDQAYLVQQQVKQQQQQQHHQQQYQKLQGKAAMAVGQGDELAETCELDDTLGVLGVLGLQ